MTKDEKLTVDELTEEAIAIMKPAFKWVDALTLESKNPRYAKEDLDSIENILACMRVLITLFIEGKSQQVKMASLMGIKVIMNDPEFVHTVMDTTEKLLSGNYKLISIIDADLLFGQAAGRA